ncbi:hypothetical protein J2X16_003795 [Pelomonas aquatica]|uniref:Uncharacterized protein n=1 Tax=Pelomonas aquatica TaxID=431058 RepID=A0ABU1ZCS6_9BURK|nr:hypothetical protein [Pelomonas aquatica]
MAGSIEVVMARILPAGADTDDGGATMRRIKGAKCR